MVEESNNPRLWLVTGVRFRDVKNCYSEYLSELKAGTIMHVLAASCEDGAFKNLGVYSEWRGNYVNVGVISAKMRDVAATYLDDNGEMDVRVVEGTISDKDFWAEPIEDEPKRPMPEPTKLPPLPIDANLVPLRTDAEMIRRTATHLLKNRIKSYTDNYKQWTFTEQNKQTKELVKRLQEYPSYCLHSLSKDEHDTLLGIISQLKELIDEMIAAQNEIKGLEAFVSQLQKELETIKDNEREYSKQEVCKRIYLDEMSEIEKQISAPNGKLLAYFEMLKMENNGDEPTIETYSSELTKINNWLNQFITTWYAAAKNDTAKLAHIIETYQISRVELNGYYFCEILAKILKQKILGNNNINDMMVHQTEKADVPSLSSLANKKIEPSDDGIDPEHIIINNNIKDKIVEAVLQCRPLLDIEQIRYGYLMKVMIDHRIINIKQSNQLKFVIFIASCFKDKPINVEKIKNSTRQGIAKMMNVNNIPSGQILMPYYSWEKPSIERDNCMQFGEILENNGLMRPKSGST